MRKTKLHCVAGAENVLTDADTDLSVRTLICLYVHFYNMQHLSVITSEIRTYTSTNRIRVHRAPQLDQF